MISKKAFGQLKTGQKIKAFTLENELGMKVVVLNYGGIIKELWVPDEKDILGNVVLGYEHIEAYEENPAYLGAMIGPSAGRIEGGILPIENTIYKLEQNSGDHTLHGGSKGFHNRVMDDTFYEDENSFKLELDFKIMDLVDGLPGDRAVKITYTLMKNRNELSLTMEASTNKNTYMNITNHSYFNLSGIENEDVLNHEMIINADAFGPVDTDMIPRKGWTLVKDTPFDFRQAKTIKSALETSYNQITNNQGIDHPFKLNKSKSDVKYNNAAMLWDPISKRKMTVLTSYPHIVIYTGNFLNEADVSTNEGMIKHQGICFEAQEVPNAPRSNPDTCQIIKAGQHYSHTIIYSFEVEN